MNIGGNMYQKFGVFEESSEAEIPGAPVDLGRYAVTKAPRDREVFRVPSLRNVAATAPYFHDGRAPTLEDAVKTMARVQLGRTITLRGDWVDRPVPADLNRRISGPAGGNACKEETVKV